MNKYKFYKKLFSLSYLSGDMEAAYYWKKLYEREEIKDYIDEQEAVDNFDDKQE